MASPAATKGIEARCRQVLRWLAHEWPTPYPVVIRWVDEIKEKDETMPGGYSWSYGDTERVGKKLVIRMSRKHLRDYSLAIDILIHEYAHARDTKHVRLENQLDRPHHGPEWGLYFAEMYSSFRDGSGWEDSTVY
jgi:hypothetical protein